MTATTEPTEPLDLTADEIISTILEMADDLDGEAQSTLLTLLDMFDIDPKMIRRSLRRATLHACTENELMAEVLRRHKHNKA